MEEIKKKFARSFAKVKTAIESITKGHMVIMTDDEDRENEGDLVFAAEAVTAEKVNFLAKNARGLICLSLTPKTVDKLELPLMSKLSNNHPKLQTAFTVSIEAKEGVSTGISASDRAETIRVAVKDQCRPQDLVVPGHIFPLRAKELGVLERPGHTEGSVDLMKLAELKPAAVICEVLKDNGELARMPELEQFSEKYKIPILSIEDLLFVKMLSEPILDLVSSQNFQSKDGIFALNTFSSRIDEFNFLTTHRLNYEGSVEVSHNKPQLLLDKSKLHSPKSLINNAELESIGSNLLTIQVFSLKECELNRYQENKILAYTALILKSLKMYDQYDVTNLEDDRNATTQPEDSHCHQLV